MNIYEELLAGKTIDENKINARYFVVKNAYKNNVFRLFFHDPAYAIPTLKMFSEHNADIKGRLLYRANGYRQFIKYVAKIDHELDLINHTYEASSLEKLQKEVDDAIINLRRVKNVECMINVSKLELFDLNDSDVLIKACA